MLKVFQINNTAFLLFALCKNCTQTCGKTYRSSIFENSVNLILSREIQNSVNQLRQCAKTLREKLKLKSFVEIKSSTGHAEIKMDSKWNGYVHFHFKPFKLLKQTKQEVIVLASSELIKARLHLAGRIVLSEVSTMTTSQSRMPLKQVSRSGQ